jgi:hypothetical protein
MNNDLLRSVASYGRLYRDEYLQGINTEALSGHPRSALDFFLSRACFQGRRDTISERVYAAVEDVLTAFLPRDGFESRYRVLESEHWVTLRRQLDTAIGKGRVGKARDAAMVVSTLEFIGRLPDLNIVNHSVRQIRLGRISNHYYELQRANSPLGIVQVGSKIAAFYLRDMVCLYRLEEYVQGEFSFCLQPIDVWVKKVASELGVASPEATDHELQLAIADSCSRNGVSPLMFNQGAWYIGYHAFDIALGLLAHNPSLP